jgi:oxygen-independent coproporphyrinogen-3 oxidase
MYELADERLSAAGFTWYEISNWARPGHASRHNLGYWRGASWEAAGPGAHAFDGTTRRWNAARLDGYLAALLPGDGSPPALPPGAADDGRDSATNAGVIAMLRLRTSSGIPRASLEDGRLREPLGWALHAGLLVEAGDRLVLTRRGRLLSNEVFARLV